MSNRLSLTEKYIRFIHYCLYCCRWSVTQHFESVLRRPNVRRENWIRYRIYADKLAAQILFPNKLQRFGGWDLLVKATNVFEAGKLIRGWKPDSWISRWQLSEKSNRWCSPLEAILLPRPFASSTGICWYHIGISSAWLQANCSTACVSERICSCCMWILDLKF